MSELLESPQEIRVVKKGSRAWLAGVLTETLEDDPSSSLLDSIWLLLPDAMGEEKVCDLLIEALIQIRCRIDGASRAQIYREVNTLREAGQKEYARQDHDAFGNFKRVADVLDSTPRDVLVVYLCKHLDGIRAWLDGHRSQREGVEGRINDAIVYFVILKGMIRAGV